VVRSWNEKRGKGYSSGGPDLSRGCPSIVGPGNRRITTRADGMEISRIERQKKTHVGSIHGMEETFFDDE